MLHLHMVPAKMLTCQKQSAATSTGPVVKTPLLEAWFPLPQPIFSFPFAHGWKALLQGLAAFSQGLVLKALLSKAAGKMLLVCLASPPCLLQHVQKLPFFWLAASCSSPLALLQDPKPFCKAMCSTKPISHPLLAFFTARAASNSLPFAWSSLTFFPCFSNFCRAAEGWSRAAAFDEPTSFFTCFSSLTILLILTEASIFSALEPISDRRWASTTCPSFPFGLFCPGSSSSPASPGSWSWRAKRFCLFLVSLFKTASNALCAIEASLVPSSKIPLAFSSIHWTASAFAPPSPW